MMENESNIGQQGTTPTNESLPVQTDNQVVTLGQRRANVEEEYRKSAKQHPGPDDGDLLG